VISNRWIDTRKPHWTRLEHLALQAETSGLKSLSPRDLRDFGLLYRQAAADLSAVRTDDASRTLEAYLNRLVARAHNFVYAGAALSPRSIGRYLAYEYPRLFRRLFPYTALAFALFTLAGLFGAMLTILRPEYMIAQLGPQMIETIHQHKMWTESILGAEPQASSAIMTNNIMVCFVTFAGGITAGLFTIFLLIQNGLSIGIVAVACQQNGLSLSLWSFVAAHGALELPASSSPAEPASASAPASSSPATSAAATPSSRPAAKPSAWSPPRSRCWSSPAPSKASSAPATRQSLSSSACPPSS